MTPEISGIIALGLLKIFMIPIVIMMIIQLIRRWLT